MRHKETAASMNTMEEEDDEAMRKQEDIEVASSSTTQKPQQQYNLFEEIHAKLASAFLMFCLPDMRDMAKKGLLQGDLERIHRIIDLPATLEDILVVFEENLQLLTKERFQQDEDRVQMYKDFLSLQRFGIVDQNASRNLLLIHVQDENDQEECVYAIGLNHVHKQVTVSFRGSVTQKDFRQDLKAVMGTIPNPVYNENMHDESSCLPDTVGVHLGFREYLYKEEKLTKVLYAPRLSRKQQANNSSTTTTTRELKEGQLKYQVILWQVKELLKDRPDYKLYIAGHSLGGALATLLSFLAAANDEVPKPVTCITSGAPKVGNIDFLQSFEELERQNKLRCIQVANDRDPVTLSPHDSLFPCWAMFCQRRRYKHVGLRLKLEGKGYTLSYPMTMQGYCGILWCDMMQISQFWIAVVFLGVAAMFCFTACSIIAIPTVAVCACRAMKTSRQHHTQLKYIRRLEYNQDSIEQFDIDSLNEERFARSRWQIPVLFKNKSGNCCSRHWEDAAEEEEEASIHHRTSTNTEIRQDDEQPS